MLISSQTLWVSEVMLLEKVWIQLLHSYGLNSRVEWALLHWLNSNLHCYTVISKHGQVEPIKHLVVNNDFFQTSSAAKPNNVLYSLESCWFGQDVWVVLVVWTAQGLYTPTPDRDHLPRCCISRDEC